MTRAARHAGERELLACLERASTALEAGAEFKPTYERLLLEVREDEGERLMQLQREARGAWLLLLAWDGAQGERPRALLVGDALSGTSVPLGHAGYRTTLLDSSPERLRFARLRNRGLTGRDDPQTVVWNGGALPFEDGRFELVVLESALAGGGPRLAELQRVCAGEFVRIADNRFAYKRSSGRRGVFAVRGPLDYARRLLDARGEQSLAGYRASARCAEFAEPRSYALYPDAREFTYVVALDQPLPSLEIGPKERGNKLKLVGHRLGLFPLLTPSFALVSTRRTRAGLRLRSERLLDELARLTREPRGELEHLVATRGNSALLLTRRAASSASERGPGDWCIHIGLSAAQRSQLATHARLLRAIAEHHRAVPVPELLFCGELEGLFVTCERRASGLTAPQHTGDQAIARTLFADAARVLAELVDAPAAPLDEAEFERLVARRFELAERYCGRPDSAANLRAMLAHAREQLLGCSFPRVVHHADLRSKHVQVDARGRITALLDWGSGKERDLPYVDLFHLLVHERKQESGSDARTAWRVACERSALRAHERAALDDYSRRLGLDERYRRAIEAIYPVLVAAMVESHWDFSRPRWLHRNFGI